MPLILKVIEPVLFTRIVSMKSSIRLMALTWTSISSEFFDWSVFARSIVDDVDSWFDEYNDTPKVISITDRYSAMKMDETPLRFFMSRIFIALPFVDF